MTWSARRLRRRTFLLSLFRSRSRRLFVFLTPIPAVRLALAPSQWRRDSHEIPTLDGSGGTAAAV